MKVAFVITRADEVGGAHVHVRDLASWLDALGHKVKVFVGGDGVYVDALRSANVPFHQLRYMKRSISPFFDILAIRELKHALSKFQPDLVSAHSAKAGIVARIACRLLKIPCIFTAHGWSHIEGAKPLASFVFSLLERILSPLAETVITVCENDRQLAVSKRLAPSVKLVTIHNGMPDVNFTGGRQSCNEVPLLVMVARFEKPKDHAILIDAMAKIEELSWHLQLIGDGPLLSEVKKLVVERGLDARVSFLGRRQDVAQILTEADVFVLTTNWEGFPRSILEAMRAGLPVVATDVAGIPESVKDSVTGYLVPPGTSDVLAQRIATLIQSRDLRKEYGTNGRAFYLSQFTFSRMADSTLSVYLDVLARQERF